MLRYLSLVAVVGLFVACVGDDPIVSPPIDVGSDAAGDARNEEADAADANVDSAADAGSDASADAGQCAVCVARACGCACTNAEPGQSCAVLGLLATDKPAPCAVVATALTPVGGDIKEGVYALTHVSIVGTDVCPAVGALTGLMRVGRIGVSRQFMFRQTLKKGAGATGYTAWTALITTNPSSPNPDKTATCGTTAGGSKMPYSVEGIDGSTLHLVADGGVELSYEWQCN